MPMRTHRQFLLASVALVLWPAASRQLIRPPTGRVSSPAAVLTDSASVRQRTLFDFGWRFHPGEVRDGQSAAIDDRGWERVDLPHDFMIRGQGQNVALPGGGGDGRRAANLPTAPEGPFDPRSPGGSSNGYLNGGIGWYRKTFTLPASASARRVSLEFEGVYMNSEVWLNGTRLGGRPYGYSTFQVDLTPQLKVGGKPNVLAVRVNVRQPSSRWYSGAGIYRHVWLTVTDPVHIEQWGTIVRTTDVSAQRAELTVRVELRNHSAADVPAEVVVAIRDRTGRVVAKPDEAVAAARRFPGLKGMDLARLVTTKRRYQWNQGRIWPERATFYSKRVRDYHVAVLDYGVKRNILRMLSDCDCRLTVLPATTTAEEVMSLVPDGVFLSNGPGDPEPCDYAIDTIKTLVEPV